MKKNLTIKSTQSNLRCNMSHIFLKLSNGDNIIGRLAMEDTGSIRIEDPVIVKLISRNHNIGYTFLGPWYSFGRGNFHTVDIQKHHIIAAFDDMSDNVSDQYEKFLDFYNSRVYNKEYDKEEDSMSEEELDALLERMNYKALLH